MADIIVKLSALIDLEPILAEQKLKGITIRQGRAEEQILIADWVRENFNSNWAMGCEVSLEQEPITCFIVIKDNSVAQSEKHRTELLPGMLVGFACYDVVTKGVLGPIGIPENMEDADIETALSLVCLHAMAQQGYEFATIGWKSFVNMSSSNN